VLEDQAVTIVDGRISCVENWGQSRCSGSPTANLNNDSDPSF